MLRGQIKKLISAGLLLAFTIGSVATAAYFETTPTSVNAKSDKDNAGQAEDEEYFNIGICLSVDNEYHRAITSGFLDAVYDTLGKDNVTVTTKIISENQSGEAIINGFVTKQMDLIFANGKAALSAASIATSETPIVSAGVIDFKSTLHILDNKWKRYTGRNITGISGSPSVANQLSLLIEASGDLSAVGILYSPEDTDSIYQNEILEKYLNQAGIPWKEYEIASTSSAHQQYEEIADAYGSVITPGEIAAASAKEGAVLDPEPLGGDGVIHEILSPNSARSPKASKFWPEEDTVEAVTEDTGTSDAAETDAETDKDDVNNDDSADETEQDDPESVPSEDEQDASEEGQASSEDANTPEDGEELSPEEAAALTAAATAEIVNTACEECNALYIAAESTLTDQIELITDIANEKKVATLGGDMTLGKHTLVTLYADPYDMGYRAGKLVKKILIDEKYPGDIKIGLPSSNVVKLYQDDVAEKLGRELPKSFKEYDAFLKEYKAGENTTRVEKEE